MDVDQQAAGAGCCFPVDVAVRVAVGVIPDGLQFKRVREQSPVGSQGVCQMAKQKLQPCRVNQGRVDIHGRF